MWPFNKSGFDVISLTFVKKNQFLFNIDQPFDMKIRK